MPMYRHCRSCCRGRAIFVACRLGVPSTHRRDYFNHFVQRPGLALRSCNLSQFTLESAFLFRLRKFAPGTVTGHPCLGQKISRTIAMEDELRDHLVPTSFSRTNKDHSLSFAVVIQDPERAAVARNDHVVLSCGHRLVT